jgi:hypothetical protein
MRTLSTDDATKRCPQCRRNSLMFRERYPVLTHTTTLARTGTDPHDGPDRLRYESAWVCQNLQCGYQEVSGDR